jgi:hypothetical protein
VPSSPFRLSFLQLNQPHCTSWLPEIRFRTAKVSDVLAKFDKLFVAHFAQACAEFVDIEIVCADSLIHFN